MKKLLFFLALCVVACTKVPQQTGAMVSVVFRISTETKAFPDAIVATIPSTIPLTVTNKVTGSAFSVNTGEAVTIPVGEYSVSGRYTPKKNQNVIGTSVYLSKSPAITILQDVSVSAGVSEYSITATYQSWVLAVDSTEASLWTMDMNYTATAVDFMVDGTTWWIFCTGNLASRFLVTQVVPKDTDSCTTATYNLTTSASYAAANNGLVVQPGKWYYLHPNSATTEAAGFSINFPSWENDTW